MADERLEIVRVEIRNVERFALRAVSDAVSDTEVHEARTLLRLAVGLRRKLDLFKRS